MIAFIIDWYGIAFLVFGGFVGGIFSGLFLCGAFKAAPAKENEPDA